MYNTVELFLVIFLIIPSAGMITYFFISIQRNFKKIQRLDKPVQKKLLLMEYYMYYVRRLTAVELSKIGTIPDEEIKCLNELRDLEESLKLLKEKINR